MWPTDANGIVHRAVMLDSGVTEREMAEAVRRGELLVVGRGQYSPPLTDLEPGRAADELYRRRCIAAGGSGALVLSHDSAAALHGIDLLYPDHERVHFTNGRSDGGYRQPNRVIHPRLLAEAEIVEIDGVLVTSLERTVVDVALDARDFSQALTVFDVGLARAVDTDGIGRLLAQRRRGVALARRAYRLADGRSESPGESWSRAQMIEARLPIPDLQVEYVLASGRLARCDFGVDDRFVGEFDGLVKYRRDMRNGEPPEEVVIREKIREDGLRDLGLDVGRWIWHDLRTGRFIPMVKRRYDRLGIRY